MNAELSSSHNHQECINQAISNAKKLCAKEGLRFTPVRKHVLQIIWQSHKPIGAYAIMDKLSKIEQRKTAPPTVYRALDFLIENNFAHRLTSLNAYIGCDNPHKSHHGQFLMCKICHDVLEINFSQINNVIQKCVQDFSFKVEQQMIEILGICNNCQHAKT